MNKGDERAYHKAPPSLGDALAVGWVWLCRRWNLLWLVPDLLIFLAAVILAGAYLPQVVELTAEYGTEEWMQSTVRAIATGVLSVTFVLTWWKGSVWLCGHNWH